MNHQATFTVKTITAATLALAASLAAPQAGWAAAFQNGNFVAYRVGSEGGTKSIFLDEYDVDGTLVQSVPLTSDTADSLAASNTGSEGLLTLSADGRCLAVPGYAAPASATLKIKATTAAAVNRAVALVGANGGLIGGLRKLGNVAYSTDSIRAAATDDCQGAWTSGKADVDANGGLWYVGGSGASVALYGANSQGLAISGGQLHVSLAGKGTLNLVSPALPKSGKATVAKVNSITTNNFRGIAFVRLQAGSAGADTLYVAANDAKPPAIQKYVLNAGAWTLSATASIGDTVEVHGLVAMPTGDGHALLMVTDGSGNVYRVFDTSGAQPALSTPQPLLAPPGGNVFYGLAATPQALSPAAVPSAPTGATLANTGPGQANVSWSAGAGAPAAFHVVEVSGDGFATVAQSRIAMGTSVALMDLQAGQKARVRAVNSLGGSVSAMAQGSASGGALPPTTTLPADTAYSGVVGVIGDGADPLATQGLSFTVADPAGDAGALQVTAASSNPAVLDGTGVVVQNNGGTVSLKLIPRGVGYSDVTLTIASGSASITRTLHYAASAGSVSNTDTRWFAGRSDASSALTVPGTDTLLIVDDEAPAQDASGNALSGGNSLFAFDPRTGGLPVNQLVPDASLGLSNTASCSNTGFTGLAKCDADGEVDMESSFLVGNRMYVAGSHSNNKNGRSRPDRWRLFAIDVSPADHSTRAAGYYQWLREDLRAWDAANGHGLGANHLGLVSSSDGGDKNPLKAPETDTLSGFSIEGSTTSPDDAHIWLGFRAPLVSAPGQPAVTPDVATGRTHALIIPVGHYAALLADNGGTKGSAQIGGPIRLDLGGRGIREIRRNTAGEYLIIAGPPNGATGTAPRDFRLFSWDGRVSSAGLALNVRALDANLAPITPPAVQCSAEGIAALPDALAQGGMSTIISDCGDAVFYGDTTVAKDLPYAAWKKFRSDAIRIAALPQLGLSAAASGNASAALTLSAAQAGTLHAVVLPAGSAEPSWEQIRAGLDALGQAALWRNPPTGTPSAAGQPVTLQAQGLAADTAYVAYAIVVPEAGAPSLAARAEVRTQATPAGQAIDFPQPADRLLGSPAVHVTATGGASGGPVNFSSLTPQVCAGTGTTGATVTLLRAGTCTLKATQVPAAGAPAPAPVERSFEIRLPALAGSQLSGADGSSGTVSGNGWQFAANSPGAASSASLPALPPGYRFVWPTGFGFVLAGGSGSGPATVALNFPQAVPGNAMLWKFGPTSANAQPHWHDVRAGFNAARTSGSFSVSDGGEGDEDGLANGVIVDPVFVVAPSSTTTPPAQATSVPTLSEAGRALLALALGGAALLGVRRRRL